MSGLRIFLDELRYQANLWALIPLDACMGIPLRLGEALYLPFFQITGPRQCRLTCEISVKYPSGELLWYRKAAGTDFAFDAQTLRNWKDAREAAGDWRELPAEFSEIYRRAVEEIT